MEGLVRASLSICATACVATGAWQVWKGEDPTVFFLLAIICKLDARHD